MNKIRLYSLIVAILALLYVYTYTLPVETRLQLADFFSLLPTGTITGYLTYEQYLGPCINESSNSAPVFNDTVFVGTIVRKINESFVHQIDYFDADNDPVLVLAASPPGGGGSVWSTVANAMNFSGFIDMTSFNKSDVGNHSVLFILNDACTYYDDEAMVAKRLITFSIQNINAPPVITSYLPDTEETLNINESDELVFSITVNDPDLKVDPVYYNESLTYNWTLSSPYTTQNKTEANTRSTTSSFTFTPEHCDAGIWTVYVNVTDKAGESDAQSWQVDVERVNLPPEHYENFPDNITINEVKEGDEHNIDVLNLSYYIRDPDVEECGYDYDYINFTSNHPYVEVDYNQTGFASITPPEYYFGPYLVSYFGNFTVNFTAEDSEGAFIISQNIEIFIENIPDAPLILSIPNQSAAAGFPFIFQVQAHHPDNFTMQFSDNTSLFEIHQDTGLINFTPSIVDLGSHSINITVNDIRTDTHGPFSTSVVFNLTVFNNSPPVFTLCEDVSTYEEQLTFIEVRFFDPEGDNITISDNASFFDFVQINNTLAEASFTPRDRHVGNHTIHVNATDSWNMTTTCTFNLEVIDINNPPVLNEIESPQHLRINHSYFYQAIASDRDERDILTFSDNSTFFDIHPSTGVISIARVEVEEGDYYVNISVCDNGAGIHEPLCVWQVVVFQVKQNNPPYFIDLETYFECQQYSLCEMSFVAGDPEDDRLNFSVNVSIFNITSAFNSGNSRTYGEISFIPDMRPGLIYFTLNVSDPWDAYNYTTITLNITEQNTPPEVILNKSTLNIIAWVNEPEEVHIYILDREDDNISIQLNDTRLFNLTKRSKVDMGTHYETYFNATFTPTLDLIGTWVIIMNITDGIHNVYENITIEIRPENLAPQFEIFSPAQHLPEDVYVLETRTINFSVNVSDPEGDNFTVEMYFNDVLISENSESRQEFLFTPGWYDQGRHTFRLVATDEHEKNATLQWTIYVLNRNREPIACKRVFNSTMDLYWVDESILENVELLESGNFSLEQDSHGDYYPDGYIISPPIYFRSFDYKNPSVFLDGFADAQLTEENELCFTNLSIQYRYGLNSPPLEMINELSWSDWSEEHFGLSYTITDAPARTRYWAFKINFYTDCGEFSPQLQSSEFRYSPKSKSILQGANMSQWIYIHDFFYDPDQDDLHTYGYNSSILSVLVDTDPVNQSWPANDWLYLSSPTTYIGNVSVNLSVSDEHNANASCIFNVEVKRRPSEVGTQIRYEIQTRTEVIYDEKIVEKEIPKLISFNLLVPESMTLYPNDTIVVPVTLDNYGNHTLKNITLSANSTHESAELFLTKDRFDIIPAGHKERTELLVTAKNIHGRFDIWISAQVQEPFYNDTAKIIMATLEKGEHNSTQLNTKVTYTEDLLKANRECMELYEMVSEARRHIQEGRFFTADEILQSATEACKYLVSLERPQDIAVTRRSTDIRLSLQNNAFIIMFLIAASFVLFVVLIYWVTLPRRR